MNIGTYVRPLNTRVVAKRGYIPGFLLRQKVVVVVLTLTSIIKSVITGQAPVTGAEEYPREKHKPKVVHAYIIADAIHASTRNI